MTWRQLYGLLAIGAAVAVTALVWSWQPERRVLRAFENLLAQVENRDWKKVETLLSPEYKDHWGLSGPELIRQASEGFRQFYWVEIIPENPGVRVEGDTAEVRARLRLNGRGTALAEAAIARAAELQEPFVLTWRRESGWSGDWKLASVSHSEIYLHLNSWE